MRTIIAAFLVFAFSSASLAASAPAVNKMSADQLQQYFAGKSVMMHDRRYGSSILYFRKGGSLHVYATGARTVGKSTWSVFTEPGKAIICLFESSARIPRAPGGKVFVRICAEARQFIREAVDIQPGDVMGISKTSKPRFALGPKKTNFAKLKAAKP